MRDMNQLSSEERFGSVERGLVTSWEIGRRQAVLSPELAQSALRGELPLLPWKGGVDRALKKRFKYGVLNYLAEWQGLRNEDLNIDTEAESAHVCSKYGVKVIFTNDYEKYKNP